MNTLRTRLILAFLIIALVPLSLLAFLNNRSTTSALTANVGANLKSLADAKALALGDRLDRQIYALRSLSSNSIMAFGMDAHDIGYPSDLAGIQAQLKSEDEQWRAAVAANDDDPLIRYRSYNVMVTTALEHMRAFPENIQILITDRYGGLAATTHRVPNYIYANEPWWRAAYNNGQGAIYIGQPTFDESSGKVISSMALPLVASDNQTIIGILRSDYSLELLLQLVDSIHLGQTGRAELLLPGDRILTGKGFKTPVDAQSLAKLQATTGEYAELDYEGKRSLVSRSSVAATVSEPSIAQLDWSLVVLQDRAESLAPARAQSRVTLLLAIVIAVVVTGAAVGGAQLLTNPITHLTSVAKQIAEGNLAAQARVESSDEIGTLATTFNMMAGRLQQTLAGLEQRVVERKRAEEELQRRNKDLMALNAIATTIGQSLDLDHILNATLDKVLGVMEVDGGWIQLLDADEGSLSLATQRGASVCDIETARKVRLGEGVTGTVAQSGQPSVVDKFSEALEPGTETGQEKSPYACAAVPIKSKDKVLGVLGVCSLGACDLSAQKVQLLTAVGHQLGVAVENVRLAEKASEVQVLRELDRLRSELVANVSHELRTPLGLIKIFCTTLLAEDVEFDRKIHEEFLSDIEREADKLEKIVDNLLDLSRMQSGRLRLDKHPTDIGQLAREVKESMEVLLTRHRLILDFPSEPLVMVVDSKRIEQVLRNLLSNAIKYSPDGGTITVRGHRDARQILVQVSDQGIGIPLQDLERVFDRFHRVENKITQRAGGVGLGLAVCRGIVEAHGGRIWLESTVGVGTTCYFTLPTSDAPQPHAEEARE